MIKQRAEESIGDATQSRAMKDEIIRDLLAALNEADKLETIRDEVVDKMLAEKEQTIAALKEENAALKEDYDLQCNCRDVYRLSLSTLRAENDRLKKSEQVLTDCLNDSGRAVDEAKAAGRREAAEECVKIIRAVFPYHLI